MKVESQPTTGGTGTTTQGDAEEAVRTLIRWIGESPGRAGLEETPDRVARAFAELYGGYRTDPRLLLAERAEPAAPGGSIVVSGFDIVSSCEHHMMPILGRVTVAYDPDRLRVAPDALGRAIDAVARRLQTQERLTVQIARAIETALRPRGVAVTVEAEHLCMTIRGLQQKGVSTLTTLFTGAFKEDTAERQRVTALLAATPRRRQMRCD